MAARFSLAERHSRKVRFLRKAVPAVIAATMAGIVGVSIFNPFRMLTNLQQSYVRRGDGEGLAWVGRLRALMPGVPLSDHTDQARLLVNLGRFSEAADVLEGLAAVVSDDEAAKLESEAGLLRARLN